MSFRSPLGRARGLGSSHEGSGHWWVQSITSFFLIPLSVWFLAQVICLSGASYDDFMHWIRVPGNAALMSLLVSLIFYHGQIGVCVILEDYVQCRFMKTTGVIGVQLLSLILGIFAVVAVLKTAFVGG